MSALIEKAKREGRRVTARGVYRHYQAVAFELRRKGWIWDDIFRWILANDDKCTMDESNKASFRASMARAWRKEINLEKGEDDHAGTA